ncbi:amidohydrolase [Jannaschia seohaensis]|uniref:Amidohydrolase n=1 Tax=Jannaschia seohaensis TaxID=475081 RepID=A0A2Y9AH88_9RHOB|nr:amidohydrolase [Jannaschia seohaensis]PWJ21317.1 amidohydrolase [Jannaschia seohaensis]SSA41727.1 amidohydrolase [Jannaschia seohaensis]
MDRLTDDDLGALIALRRDLHRRPDLSGAEAATAATVAQALSALGVEVVTGLGGHGVAGIVPGGAPGPTVLLRCELDALPIAETGQPAWRSETPGVAHLCGHDGHMATLLGAVRLLRRDPPPRGRVIAMFQPAEEDGSGAIAVCEDPRFAPLAPDWAFALHNLPDLPRGVAHVPDGLASAASVGLAIALTGVEAHASAPETGRSPAPELARLMDTLPALSRAVFPAPDFRLVTLTHARLGAPAFGIAPGRGEVFATLRTSSDAALAALEAEARALIGQPDGLSVEITEHDRFLAGVNDPEAAALLREAAKAAGLEALHGTPLRASEDFGRFGHDCPAAMLLLGAGPGPALHNPDYDFDDRLIAPGAATLAGTARLALSRGG